MLRTRIAPTPSGLLHPGNGLSFIVTWSIARAAEGKLLLRIDDLDDGRRRPEYLEDIFRTLDWLGLDYDEGPKGVEDFLRHYSQHSRLDLYRETLAELRRRGLLYACTCSRRQIRERSPDGRYPNTCRQRGLPFGASQTAWRIHVPEHTAVSIREWTAKRYSIDLSEEMGDFVIRQKNIMPAYQIASLMDDLHYDINFIVRGADLLHSTAAQLFLAGQLDATPFLEAAFWHHALLKSVNGEKLSKTKGAGSLKAWREQGRSPRELYRLAGAWLGAEEGQFDSLTDLLPFARQLLQKFPVGDR
jgi:glutamyl/glutaminyl-tRNA synthetase